MKKLLIILFSTFMLTAPAWAAGEAVEMIDFQHNAGYVYSLISLRNNTSMPVRNVTFRIIYKDMNGNNLDYKEYTISNELAPGLTKRERLSANENIDGYYYYKSETRAGYKPYKIEYQLLKYDGQEKSGNQFVPGRDSNGSSWSLPGRDLMGMPKPSIVGNQEGIVVVKITVNQNGKVVEADIAEGTTIADQSILESCKNAAKRTQFSPSLNLGKEIGTITYRFREHY